MNKITIDLEKITADLDLCKQEKARLSFELKNVEKEIEKMEMQYGLYSFG